MNTGGVFGPAPHIPRPHPTVDASPVTFSFKYLDFDSNPKFHVQRWRAEFLINFLQELYEICQGQVSDLAEFSNLRHNHIIDFDNTTEQDGFAHLPEQVQPEVYWQFAVQEHHEWRVHGFFIASVFYVVWLDPDHQLCTTN